MTASALISDAPRRRTKSAVIAGGWGASARGVRLARAIDLYLGCGSRSIEHSTRAAGASAASARRRPGRWLTVGSSASGRGKPAAGRQRSAALRACVRGRRDREPARARKRSVTCQVTLLEVASAISESQMAGRDWPMRRASGWPSGARARTRAHPPDAGQLGGATDRVSSARVGGEVVPHRPQRGPGRWGAQLSPRLRRLPGDLFEPLPGDDDDHQEPEHRPRRRRRGHDAEWDPDAPDGEHAPSSIDAELTELGL